MSTTQPRDKVRAIEREVLANAFLFEAPEDYAQGVRDALALVREAIERSTASATRRAA